MFLLEHAELLAFDFQLGLTTRKKNADWD